jgi:hypothetical protein
MARAAQDLGCAPRELSFAGAWQAVRAFGERLLEADATQARQLHEWLVLVVSCYQVGDRPDRVEPRARKRRPKHGAFLTNSREQARAGLRHGVRA